MLTHQRQAHERLQERLRDRIRTHEQRPMPSKRRGLGFMEDPKRWGKKAHDKSPMRGRKT